MVEVATLYPPPPSTIIHTLHNLLFLEDREVQSRTNLKARARMAEHATLDERMRRTAARLETEQQVPSGIMVGRPAQRCILVVQATAEIEVRTVPRRHTEFQVAAEADARPRVDEVVIKRRIKFD